jgi:Cys-tRNA(Pro)/Cys-tRNA(Cys) deacylase
MSANHDRTPVTEYLTRAGIPFQTFRHPGPIHSLEQAAAERGQRPEQIIRSIVFRLAQDEFVMVLVAGPKQISWAALRKYLNQSRLTMASEDEVLQATGYRTGAVSPLGLSSPMRILVDDSVLTEQEISIGSGERGLTILMQRHDLLRALDQVEFGAFTDE